MERLTRRSANGTGVYATPSGEPIEWENNRHNVLQKLADYEGLEEQGRLIKLPCKVGDTVWDNDFGRPCAYTITAFSFGECEEYICEPVTTKKPYSIMQTQAEVSQEVLQKVKSASQYF